MSPSGQTKAKLSELNNNNIILIIIMTKLYAASENSVSCFDLKVP